MTPIEIVNLLVAMAALGIAAILSAIFRTLRPWRQNTLARLPEIGRPLTCVANEVGMLPWVFAAGALSRLAAAFGFHSLTVVMTGVAAAITGITAWNLWRALQCARRSIAEARVY